MTSKTNLSKIKSHLKDIAKISKNKVKFLSVEKYKCFKLSPPNLFYAYVKVATDCDFAEFLKFIETKNKFIQFPDFKNFNGWDGYDDGSVGLPSLLILNSFRRSSFFL